MGELRPDLVVLQGAEDRIRESLADSGLHEVYPHRLFFPMSTLPFFCGTAVYSRTPVVETSASTARQAAVRVLQPAVSSCSCRRTCPDLRRVCERLGVGDRGTRGHCRGRRGRAGR